MSRSYFYTWNEYIIIYSRKYIKNINDFETNNSFLKKIWFAFRNHLNYIKNIII